MWVQCVMEQTEHLFILSPGFYRPIKFTRLSIRIQGPLYTHSTPPPPSQPPLRTRGRGVEEKK